MQCIAIDRKFPSWPHTCGSAGILVQVLLFVTSVFTPGFEARVRTAATRVRPVHRQQPAETDLILK